MFTVTIEDERVYRELMDIVEFRQASVDDVLRDLLLQEAEGASSAETPALKLLRLIDETELPFTQPFDAREAESILSAEMGEPNWRNSSGNHGAS